MSIKVASASQDHGNYFKVTVDGQAITLEGEKGIGMVVVEKGTRKITMSRIFNIELDESNKLITAIQHTKPGSVIILGVKGEGTNLISLELVQTIGMLGSNLIHTLGSKDSWAFIVKKGNSQSAKEVKDSHNAVELTVMKKPLLHHIMITSSSFDHGNNFTLTINNHPNNLITYNNPDESGIVLVILDREGNIRMNQIFNTHDSPAASDELESTIQSVLSQYPGNLIILGVKDDGSRSLSASARRLIGSLGSLSIHQLGYRDSWCFISRLGKPPSAKELRDSHHPVTLSWVPTKHNFSSSPLPSSFRFNPPNFVQKPADSFPLQSSPLHQNSPAFVDFPVHSVHHKGLDSGVGVSVGSVNQCARRRDTLG